METIQVVLGAPLLRAADRAARRLEINRSALVRAALEQVEREAHDRDGYRRRPDGRDDVAPWEGVAAWPEE